MGMQIEKDFIVDPVVTPWSSFRAMYSAVSDTLLDELYKQWTNTNFPMQGQNVCSPLQEWGVDRPVRQLCRLPDKIVLHKTPLKWGTMIIDGMKTDDVV